VKTGRLTRRETKIKQDDERARKSYIAARAMAIIHSGPKRKALARGRGRDLGQECPKSTRPTHSFSCRPEGTRKSGKEKGNVFARTTIGVKAQSDVKRAALMPRTERRLRPE